MKVAIASSGLGHITRGIETWAQDTASALHRRNLDVTLFSAAPVAGTCAPTLVLPCLKRNARLARIITRHAPGWTWRWHLKSPYALEQLTFWLHLKPELRKRHIDILHVQDPLLAYLAQQAYIHNRIPTRTLLAHGTEEPLTFLQQFPYLQHLAPWHLEQSLQALTAHPAPQPGSPFAQWTAIPNFVDTTRFQPPADPAAASQLRKELHIPAHRTVIGTAAAIKKHHKRIDCLIRTFARAQAQNPDLHLVIAGSRQRDTDELEQLAEQLAPGHVTFLINYPHERMPALLQSWDWFVLTSLFEMMPIALLEAIATGLPAITHPHPVLTWMAGEGGLPVPMDQPDTLATTLAQLDPAARSVRSAAARQHALTLFSEEAVIPRYIDWYRHMHDLP